MDQVIKRPTIVLIAVGSRGDVQPYIALGQGLSRAGYAVRMVTNKDFETLVQSYGLEAWTVDINIQAALQAQESSAAIERGGLITSFRKLAELARAGTAQLFEVALRVARDADIILAGFSGLLVGASLTEKLGLPFVQAYNVPLTPTAAFPGALLPWLSVRPYSISHRLSHWATRQVVWQSARAAGNHARMALLGLPSAPVTGMFESKVFHSGPVLYGFSPSVLPHPSDWDAQIHVTGYWFADEPNSWNPPTELVDFLQGGDAPVYIGFGSMSSEQPAEVMQIILGTLARQKRRAIVHSGWAGLGAERLPEHVFVVGSVPHSWLFPRVRAIVHHGGAGTTAAAVRAGAPQVVVPFHGDQPFWADLTWRLGVGTAPIARRKLNARRLAAAIETALGDGELRRKAAELGAQVRQEDGVKKAVEVIAAHYPLG
jgi:UDP:flavonoid glycosyltransferase YjiC (YdhE family)